MALAEIRPKEVITMKTKTLLKVAQWGLVFGWLPVFVLVGVLTHGNQALLVSWMLFGPAAVLILGAVRYRIYLEEKRRERGELR